MCEVMLASGEAVSGCCRKLVYPGTTMQVNVLCTEYGESVRQKGWHALRQEQ